MQEDTKCTDSHPATDVCFARAVHISGSDDDVRKPESLGVVDDELILLDFGETVGAAQLWLRFNRTGFIERHPAGFVFVRVDRKGADVDESSEAFVPYGCVEKVARRYDGVHEGAWERLPVAASGEVKDERRILGRSSAIIGRQQISGEYLDPRLAMSAGKANETGCVAGRSRETPQVAKAAIHQSLY
jgi:hypothetical protein